MATGWVKSLQCKSRAFEDVHHPTPKALNLLHSASCRKTAKTLKDVVADSTQQRQPPRHRHPPPIPTRSIPPNARSVLPPSRSPNPFFPTLTELPEGHSSRNVVEIIFHTSWSHKAFPGTIEMIFKVQNLPRTVARFEEFREAVKARAAAAGNPGSRREENARCMADGNEVMRFHCVGPADAEVYDAGVLCTFSGKGGGSICTFSGSGRAHEIAGGGKGRRAMLVCRVIAGRVCKRVDSLLENSVCGNAFESVSGENGALVVFDPNALLPCFLIIYKL